MFDIGFWEISIIFVIALLVVGPEKMPELARKAGLYIGKIRRFVSNVRSDIERELRTDELEKMLNEQKQQIEELKGVVQSGKSQIEEEIRDAEKLVKSSVPNADKQTKDIKKLADD